MSKPCFECGDPAEHDHHVIPRSLGGTATVPLCEPCHWRAHNRKTGKRKDSHKALVKEALQHKKSRGERVGAIPYGQRLAADGVHLEPHPAEQRVIAAVRELRACGLSLRAIAAELARRGMTSRKGRPFAATQISRMLADDDTRTMPAKQPGGSKNVTLAVCLPPDLLAKADEATKQLATREPRRRWSRASTLRHLLLEGLRDTGLGLAEQEA